MINEREDSLVGWVRIVCRGWWLMITRMAWRLSASSTDAHSLIVQMSTLLSHCLAPRHSSLSANVDTDDTLVPLSARHFYMVCGVLQVTRNYDFRIHYICQKQPHLKYLSISISWLMINSIDSKQTSIPQVLRPLCSDYDANTRHVL